MKCFAVIGAGFGDEGKGLVTDYLCSVHKQPLVVRFSGGHQSGHHVVIDNIRDHVFSNFGSGSFRGVPTYWSHYCTIDPVGIIQELEILNEKGVNPVLFIDARCPVTTPFDIVHNRETEAGNLHGSCGVGVGATIEREENMYSLVFGDLFYPSVFRIKLDMIRKYYQNNDLSLDVFLYCCDQLVRSECISAVEGLPLTGCETLIFEGSQGLLLDQKAGFFPHVTRSSTGTKNILDMGFSPGVFLVSRAYQTRHGNGPMTNEHIPHNIRDNPHEKNTDHPYQGKFRQSLLDLDLLKYAISRDDYISGMFCSLVITCLDLVKSEYRFTMNGRIVYCDNEHDFVSRIMKHLNISRGLLSRSPFGSEIETRAFL